MRRPGIDFDRISMFQIPGNRHSLHPGPIENATMDFTTNTSSLQNVQGQFLGNWNPEKEISDSHLPQFTS
jgi:hypothetical protein